MKAHRIGLSQSDTKPTLTAMMPVENIIPTPGEAMAFDREETGEIRYEDE